jgi:hypothetical protein
MRVWQGRKRRCSQQNRRLCSEPAVAASKGGLRPELAAPQAFARLSGCFRIEYLVCHLLPFLSIAPWRAPAARHTGSIRRAVFIRQFRRSAMLLISTRGLQPSTVQAQTASMPAWWGKTLTESLSHFVELSHRDNPTRCRIGWTIFLTCPPRAGPFRDWCIPVSATISNPSSNP